MRKWSLIGAALLLAGRAAMSQLVVGPAVFTPASPTAQDTIRATYIFVGACGMTSSTVVAGTVVRTTVSVGGCIIGPPPGSALFDVFLGPLPAGTYTYETYEVYEGGTAELISTQPLIVSIAAPTLSPWVSAPLVLALAAIALVTYRG